MSQAQQEAILRGKQETFGEFIWNSERGEFLGRTGTSWAKIFVFYCIYYGFLAAFFSICMLLFYTTLTPETLPKYTPGNEDSILKNPSMGYRPRPPSDNIESSMITYTSGDNKTYEKWTSSMNDLLTGKEDVAKNYQLKKKADNVVDCHQDTILNETLQEVCSFSSEQLGPYCNMKNDFGFKGDSPCIILKLNRMIGWKPDVYEDLSELPDGKDGKDPIPPQLKEHIEIKTANNNNVVPKMLWVACTGENPMDNEMLGNKIEYYPQQGFPMQFFPYMNQPNYLSPLIAVRFVNPKPYVLINVLCKIWGKGITYDKKGGLGMVHFELLKDKPKV